jgi:hypothetical protein
MKAIHYRDKGLAELGNSSFNSAIRILAEKMGRFY